MTHPGTEQLSPYAIRLAPALRQRVMSLAMWTGLGLQAFFAAGGAFLYFEPPWLSYANLPVPVLTSPLHAGDVIPLYVVRCNALGEVRVYNSTRTIERMGSRGEVLEVIMLTPTVISAEAGCKPVTSRVNVTPADLKSGRYRAAGKAQIENSLRTHWVPWYSQEFDVVAKPPEAPSGGQ